MFRSIHTRLLAWLVIPLLFMSAAHLISTYINTHKTSERIFDKLLVTLALTISEHALASEGDLLTEDLLELIRVTTNDNLYYKVIGPNGSFVTGYNTIPEPQSGIQELEEHLYFYDAVFLDQKVRVIAVSSLIEGRDLDGWMTTFVAQTINDRNAYIDSILADTIFRVIILVVVASVLLYVGVSFGLQPLKQLQASVQQRHPKDLSPLDQGNLPREITGLVFALNHLLQRLSANTSLTKRFVENAAHQLRTPVAALLPQTDMALRRAESERERVAVGKIKRNAENIARLTHQLLNLTTAEAIALGYQHFKTIDLAEAVKKHTSIFLELYPDADLKLELQPTPMQGDELCINEVIDNLLDNARKYGDSSQAIIVRTFQQDTQCILEVSDQGCGVPEACREKVTERFYRLSHDSTGSGLGLAIVKEIVQAHRGQLEIGSGPDGLGTCVRCRFPILTES